MDEGSFLLQAILESPADDMPRLVYADWLQENGQEERAEFIRVQCALAELDRCADRCRERIDFCCATCSRESLLKTREKRIYDAHIRSFAKPPLHERGHDLREAHSEYGGVRVVWSRGAVGSIVCSLSDWLTLGEIILAQHPIEEIRVPAFSVEIEPPGTDHGWQLYYYHPGSEDSHFAMSGALFTRAEMVARLLQDVRDLESEFA